MDMPLVEQVRSFNRTMTERVGVLNDHFLGRNHPLGEARLLWEIGTEGASVRELRRRLGLDSAYVSRLLRSLEGQGLVVVGAGPNDGRVRQVPPHEARPAEAIGTGPASRCLCPFSPGTAGREPAREARGSDGR